MIVSVELSIYPLKEKHTSPFLEDAFAIFRSHELAIVRGSMSSIVTGESEKIFQALREIYDKISSNSQVVIVAKFSNACPVDFEMDGK
jgi:uncharacterized protein YqgV (UPF0045/DUF77 family)